MAQLSHFHSRLYLYTNPKTPGSNSPVLKQLYDPISVGVTTLSLEWLNRNEHTAVHREQVRFLETSGNKMMSLHYKNIWFQFFANLPDTAYMIRVQQWNSGSSAMAPVTSFQNWSLLFSALSMGEQELFSCAQNSNGSKGAFANNCRS